jgi:hypothetical protein
MHHNLHILHTQNQHVHLMWIPGHPGHCWQWCSQCTS